MFRGVKMSELSAMYRAIMGPIGDRMVSLVDSLIPIETTALTEDSPRQGSAASPVTCQRGAKDMPSGPVQGGSGR